MIPTQWARTRAQGALLQTLDGIRGPKSLVLDWSLVGVLNLVVETSVLKSHNVSQMVRLDVDMQRGTSEGTVVFFSTCTRANIQIICDHVRKGNASYYWTVVPNISSAGMEYLTDAGVQGKIEVIPLDLGFLPIAENVLSLEMRDEFFNMMYLRDSYDIYNVASSLSKLTSRLGRIPKILAKGDVSAEIARQVFKTSQPSETRGMRADKAMELEQEEKGERTALSLEWTQGVSGTPVYDALIVLDRTVDVVSAVARQLTYDGLLDEFIHIENQFIEINTALLQSDARATGTTSQDREGASEKQTRKKKLTDEDGLYHDLKNVNFTSAGAIISHHAQRVSDGYTRRPGQNAASVHDIHAALGSLNELQYEHQNLRVHTSLTEQLMGLTDAPSFTQTLEIQQNLLSSLDIAQQIARIHDLIVEGTLDAHTILRLLIVASLTVGNIKNINEIKEDFVQTYGYDYVGVLAKLSDMGLIPKGPGTKSSFSALARSFRLVVDIDDRSPDDIGFVFSGYAPLSVRLVQCAFATYAKLGWSSIEDSLKMIPGAVYESGSRVTTVNRQILVMYVGGITRAEIAALQWLSEKAQIGITILTTSVITSEKLLRQLRTRMV